MSRKSNRALQQSGVIPYRVRNGEPEILLITNRRHQKWVIPKGGISKGMTPLASAAKEAWEEAGVIGQVDSGKFGTYSYHKRGNTYRVKVFLLSVETILSDWPEANQRQRQWLDITTAIEQVKPAALKRLLKTSSHQIHPSSM